MESDVADSVEELLHAADDPAADPNEIVDVLRSFDSVRDEALVQAAAALLGHPLPEVRLELAMFLGRVGVECETPAVAPLLRLMADESESVRFWACYSLGSLRADSPEIREAFFDGTGDFMPHVRAECVEALARRRDSEVAPIVEAALEDPEELESQYLAAAAWLGLPAFTEALQSVSPWDELSAEYRQAALDRCDPARTEDRTEQLSSLLAAVTAAVQTRQPTWAVAMSEHRFGRRPHPSEELSITDQEGNVVGYGAWALLHARANGSPEEAAAVVMGDLFRA